MQIINNSNIKANEDVINNSLAMAFLHQAIKI